MKDYYEILEVNKKASKEIINKVYKIQVKKYHPDLQSEQDKQKAEEKIKQINEAYEILSDEIKRKEYDETLLEKEQNKTNSLIQKENEELKNQIGSLLMEIEFLKSQKTTSNFTNQTYNYNTHEENFSEDEYYQPDYKNVISEKLKSLLALIITIIVILILIGIVYSVPEWRNYIIRDLLMIKGE